MTFDNVALAKFLEDAVKDLITSDAEQVAIFAKLTNGDMHTIYYNCRYPLDIAMLGVQVQADAMMDIVFANAKEIVDEAEGERYIENGE